MASVNKCIIVGRLGRSPEARTFPNGDMVCNVTIATSEKWRDKNTGEAKEATEWHKVTFHKKLAEIASQYLQKGSEVYVEGSLKTRKYTDKDGQEKYSTEINATSMQMLGGKPQEQDSGYGSNSSQPARQQRQAPAPQQRAASGFDDLPDDCPF